MDRRVGSREEVGRQEDVGGRIHDRQRDRRTDIQATKVQGTRSPVTHVILNLQMDLVPQPQDLDGVSLGL